MTDGDPASTSRSATSTQEHPVTRTRGPVDGGRPAPRRASRAAPNHAAPNRAPRRAPRRGVHPDDLPPPRRRRSAPAGGASRRGRSASQRTLLGVGVVAVVLVLLVAAVAIYGAKKIGEIPRSDVAVDGAAVDEPQNYLVVGSDSREVVDRNDPNAGAFLAGVSGDMGRRSDTIMIVRVDPQGETVDLLSLPRDLWLPIAGSGTDRINSAYSGSGGPQRLIDTIRQNLGIEINHYVEVDFKGFKSIVSAIGGVPMYFDRPMRDTNSGVRITKAGCQVLDGDAALAFARSRHLQYQDKNGLWKDDPTGDLGRISRQQYFMRLTFAQAARKVVSPDLRVGNDVVSALVDSVTVDNALDVAGMIPVAKDLASLPSERIRTYSLPVTAYTTGGGGAVVRMSASSAQPILNTFRGLPADAVPPSAVPFDVAYGTGLSAKGTAARDQLAPLGFTAGALVEAGSNVKQTSIHYPEGDEALAAELARHVSPTPTLVLTPKMKDNRMQLVVGADFVGAAAPRGTTPASAAPGAAASPSSSSPSSSASPSSSVSSAGGAAAGASSTATTEPVLGGTDTIGIVPGQPPPGVTCQR